MSNMYLLTGMTGSGKTRLLKHLRLTGHQTLHLEELAQHSGSVFGGAYFFSPTQKEFDTWLRNRFGQFAAHRPVWTEWKGTVLGELFLPEWLLDIQNNATRIFLDIPFDIRLQHILQDYATLDLVRLETGYRKIIHKFPEDLRLDAETHLTRKDRTDFIKTLMAYFDRSPNYASLQANADLHVHVHHFNEEDIVRQMLALTGARHF